MRLKAKIVGFRTNKLRKRKDAIMKKVASKGVSIFKKEIRKRKLINTKNLISSVGATINVNKVIFDIGSDYANILNRGVRKHKMKYLLDSGPIPIITKTGEKIYRVVSRKNLKNGWTHPGFKRGKGFFDISVKKIENVCKEIVISEGLI